MGSFMYFCDLCGLPVEVPGFELQTGEGTKRFCCDGCLGIYRMLHEDEIPAEKPAEAGPE
jgi:hypothetical protein